VKILVVGGAGFIGRQIVRSAIGFGFDVAVFDRTEFTDKLVKCHSFIGDVCVPGAIENIISKFDVVYHLAGVADIEFSRNEPLETIKANVIGSANVLDACATHNKRLMFGSTLYVNSIHGSFYAATKKSVEEIIDVYSKERGLKFTSLRYGSLYGPEAQDWNGIKSIVREIVVNKKLNYNGTGEELREYIHVSDAARMSLKVMDDKYINKAVTITGIQTLSVSHVIKMVQEIYGVDANVNFNSESEIKSHYNITPYHHKEKTGIRLVDNEYIDFGQGLLDLIEEILNESQADGAIERQKKS
jgi:UDP-glucose 4-epimerase